MFKRRFLRKISNATRTLIMIRVPSLNNHEKCLELAGTIIADCFNK